VQIKKTALAAACALILAAAALAAAPASNAVTAGSASVRTAGAVVPALYRNCTSFNGKYSHGVGRLNARDRTKSSTPGVTTFKRSTRIYRIAMSWHPDLDRDRDGVACEKK
jgi:hypothetical protein